MDARIPRGRVMKITIVQGAFFPVPPLMGGAIEKAWWALAGEFARRGHHVTHISRQHRDLPTREVVDGVEHVRVPGFDAPRSLLWLKVLDLVYSLRALQVLPEADVLVTHTFWLPMLVRSARRGRLYVHVGRYPKGQMKFYGHAARLQTVSSAVADAIRDQAPKLAGIVQVIPYPCESPPVAPSIGGREKILLYVGRIHPEKGIQLLIEALLRLRLPALEEWKFVLVGPSEEKFGGGGYAYLQLLQNKAAPLGDRVMWIGAEFNREKLGSYYLRAPIFIYPSLAERGETFGLAPLEAMACGCAPVVSNLACFRDFIVEGDTGYVFDHQAADPAGALVAKLEAVMSDLPATAKTACRAEQRSRDFRLGAVAGQYLNDFATLVP